MMKMSEPFDLENHNGRQQEAVISDKEADLPPQQTKAKTEVKKTGGESKIKAKEQPDKITKNLEAEYKAAVDLIDAETDNEAKCKAMEKLVQLVLQREDLERDQLPTLASCLCELLQDQIEGKVFPETVSPETLENSVGKPLFVLLRNVVDVSDYDDRQGPLFTLLAEMYTHQPGIGYLLLYYIHASSSAQEMDESSRNNKMQAYREFCNHLNKKLEECLMDDLKLCQEEDIQLLGWLAPAIYNAFPNTAIGHANLLHLVVSSVDARQLQELVCWVVQGRLTILKKDTLQHILQASLMWETFEQVCLWQLVSAHSMAIETIMPILEKLDFASHAEALTAILLMLQQERPTADLVKQVLSRDVGPNCDLFVISVLLSWCREHEDTLAELIASLLSSRCQAIAAANKQKRAGTRASAAPSAERILGHLDRLRTATKQLFTIDAMQKALQQVQSACTESQKNQFSNLFALAKVDENTVGRSRRLVNSPPANKRQLKEIITDSSDLSTEEEDIMKPKQAKRKDHLFGSDSD